MERSFVFYQFATINIFKKIKHFEDYRVICELRDHELVVLVVRLGHRKEVYRKS